MKRYAVLVAGGSGKRMQNEIPKQFLCFNNKPIVVHTIERFFVYDNNIKIILVIPQSSENYWAGILKTTILPCPVQIIFGGASRSDSSRAGLSLVPEDALVAIHDAVRPLLSEDLIRRCFDAAEKYGNACPAITATDTLRKQSSEGTISVNRSEFFQVQTPQCFRAKLIKDAFAATNINSFTDEISLYEQSGNAIHIVEGERWNIKITYPEDLLVASVLSKHI